MMRLEIIPNCNTSGDVIDLNIRKSSRYQRITQYGTWFNDNPFPPCAVVGGGPSVANHLDELRNWKGDIYAINDVAKYLSDNGITCYLYAVDCTRNEYRIGDLVKGAVFASRVHRKQFNMFHPEDIRIFDMVEDNPEGITGGPTAASRTAILMLRMGYQGIHYFGCEGSFGATSHVFGTWAYAYRERLIVKAGGVDYATNSHMMLQSQHLADHINMFAPYLVNHSGGLLQAMLDHPKTWEVAAYTKDIKDQLEKKGPEVHVERYHINKDILWKPEVRA